MGSWTEEVDDCSSAGGCSVTVAVGPGSSFDLQEQEAGAISRVPFLIANVVIIAHC